MACGPNDQPDGLEVGKSETMITDMPGKLRAFTPWKQFSLYERQKNNGTKMMILETKSKFFSRPIEWSKVEEDISRRCYDETHGSYSVYRGKTGVLGNKIAGMNWTFYNPPSVSGLTTAMSMIKQSMSYLKGRGEKRHFNISPFYYECTYNGIPLETVIAPVLEPLEEFGGTAIVNTITSDRYESEPLAYLSLSFKTEPKAILWKLKYYD